MKVAICSERRYRSGYCQFRRIGAQMDVCDPVVIKAIKNVTSRDPKGLWWEYLLHERTQAIYDEIKRLDSALLKKVALPPTKRTVKSQSRCTSNRNVTYT
jgi:hypothetical protein